MGVWAILVAIAQMSRAKGDVSTWQMPLGDGHAWNWISYDDDDGAILSLQTSSPFKGYWEKSCTSGTWQETREHGGGKEMESSSFPSPFFSLVAVCIHSLVSQFRLGIPGKIRAIYLQGTWLCLQVCFSTHLNQPLTINNTMN